MRDKRLKIPRWLDEAETRSVQKVAGADNIADAVAEGPGAPTGPIEDGQSGRDRGQREQQRGRPRLSRSRALVRCVHPSRPGRFDPKSGSLWAYRSGSGIQRLIEKSHGPLAKISIPLILMGARGPTLGPSIPWHTQGARMIIQRPGTHRVVGRRGCMCALLTSVPDPWIEILGA